MIVTRDRRVRRPRNREEIGARGTDCSLERAAGSTVFPEILERTRAASSSRPWRAWKNGLSGIVTRARNAMKEGKAGATQRRRQIGRTGTVTPRTRTSHHNPIARRLAVGY